MELPGGFTARQLVRSDLDDMYAVAEAYDIEMLGEPDLEKADIEAFWRMPNFHLDTDSLGVGSPQRRGNPATRTCRGLCGASVHTGNRRRGRL